MNKKETLEFLINGLKEQFEELGKEIGIDGHSADVAKVRLETVVTILALEQLIEENKFKANTPNFNIESESCEPINDNYIDFAKLGVKVKIDLSNIPTDDLIDELIKRAEDDGAVG